MKKASSSFRSMTTKIRNKNTSSVGAAESFADHARNSSDIDNAGFIRSTDIGMNATKADNKKKKIASTTKQPYRREPMKPYIDKSDPHHNRLKYVPDHIVRPPYAATGMVAYSRWSEEIMLHTPESVAKMREAGQLAASILHLACHSATAGVTTNEMDTLVHEAIIAAGAYPSPLNYCGFPKSVCTSINEIICHGIPDDRPLQNGDVISFDVSCYYNGVHGDNCATVIVGDTDTNTKNSITHDYAIQQIYGTNDITSDVCDWRGVPYQQNFDTIEEYQHYLEARRLVQATRESLFAGLEVCAPGVPISDIGHAIEAVADHYGYRSIKKYRGHGISHIFHTAPYIKHYRNLDSTTLQPGMIFTIEPMLIAPNASTATKTKKKNKEDDDCYEWDDHWTVSTYGGALAAQFEHTVYIHEQGADIITIPR